MARLHHPVFRRNIVHKPNGHEQKHRKLRHPFCRHKGNILQHLHRGLFLCLCEADIFRQLTGDKILFFYHNERADRDFRLGAALAQNRRDKACEPHRTKIDILAAEALGLRPYRRYAPARTGRERRLRRRTCRSSRSRTRIHQKPCRFCRTACSPDLWIGKRPLHIPAPACGRIARIPSAFPPFPVRCFSLLYHTIFRLEHQ